MRATRLLSLVMILQLRGRATAEALAEELGVSVRTIYRDLDALGVSGVPLQSEAGPGGGYQLVDGYRTRLTGLAQPEAEALFLIGLPGPAAALGMGRAVADAARKVLASLPQAQGSEAARLGARFHVDPLDWYRDAEPVPYLPLIARAVLDQRALTMTYRSWTGTRPQTVEPLGLVLKAGAWYLVARASRKVCTFKVSNVLELTILERTFVRPAGFELASHWAAEQARFEASLRRETARLRASPLGLERLAQLGAFAAQAVHGAGPADADGWAPVQLPIEGIEHAALLLLGLGPELEVVAPTALRARLGELARQVAHRARRPRRPRRARR